MKTKTTKKKSEEFTRFENLGKHVFNVPKEEIKRREEAEKKAKEKTRDVV